MSEGHGGWYWHELMTKDVDKARAFYGGVFGWKTQAMPMPNSPGQTYHIWMQGDQSHGGMMAIEAPGSGDMPPQWMIYVRVDDADLTAAKVVELGGTTLMPPMDAPEIGRFGVMRDPSGAVIGFIAPAPPRSS